MKIFIKETAKIKDLTISDKNGIEWTKDLLENDEATTYNESTGQHEMSQADFEWWEEYINNSDSDELEIESLIEEFGIEEAEIQDKIMKKMALCNDLGDEHSIKLGVFNEIREAHKN